MRAAAAAELARSPPRRPSGGPATVDPRHAEIVDCGAVFLAPRSEEAAAGGGAAPAELPLNLALMPDGLHPNAAGYELWAACLAPHVARLARELVTDI